MDSGKLDLAADCYMNALEIKHTRAHQGLARVYHQRNQRQAAFDEMTKLIEKAQNNASAYEKRSEYCGREMAKSDLDIATQLDPLRTYPYRYRAAGNIYNPSPSVLLHSLQFNFDQKSVPMINVIIVPRITHFVNKTIK